MQPFRLTLFGVDKRINLIEFERIVKLVNNKAEFIIFPEMTVTGFSVSNIDLTEDLKNSDLIRKIQNIAKENQINIVFEMMISKGVNKYNSRIALNSKGEIEGNYEKIYLFQYSGEDKLISRGNEVKNFSWKGCWGLSICFDLRFPELYPELSKVNLILVIKANQPKPRVDHWKTLLYAGAIENQSFMIGVNRIGVDGNGLEYEESSYVFSPTGEIIEPCEIIQDVKIFYLNLDHALEYRKISR